MQSQLINMHNQSFSSIDNNLFMGMNHILAVRQMIERKHLSKKNQAMAYITAKRILSCDLTSTN